MGPSATRQALRMCEAISSGCSGFMDVQYRCKDTVAGLVCGDGHSIGLVEPSRLFPAGALLRMRRDLGHVWGVQGRR